MSRGRQFIPWILILAGAAAASGAGSDPPAAPVAPAVHYGPAEGSEPSPLTDEDVAVAEIERAAARRVAELDRQLGAATDSESIRDLQARIAAEKRNVELLVVQAMIEFAEAAGDDARLAELLDRLDGLLRPRARTAPADRSAAVGPPAVEPPGRQASREEVQP